MNILHVLSQFEVTGAEAYAATLIEEQARKKHTVYVVSDTLTLPTSAIYLHLPIGKRSYPQRVKNIFALREIIRSHNIHIVHAHSRAASWVSYFATRIMRTPFVSTVHGRQHVHTSSKAFNIYGRHIIAVCESVRNHLIKDLGFPPTDVVVIPNAISLQWWKSATTTVSKMELLGIANDRKVVMFVGRLTGPKGDVVRWLIKESMPSVFKQTGAAFVVVGGMITPKDIPELVSSANQQFDKPIVLLKGFQKDIHKFIATADIVIGSGRVVPESLAMGKTVIAFGESEYVGPMTKDTFHRAAETNFGDTGTFKKAEPQRITSDLISLLEHPGCVEESQQVTPLVKARFDAPEIAKKIAATYERAQILTLSPQAIPVLMYHRVISAPPQQVRHGIWVTANRFEAQLRSLKRRRFGTITFRDYAAFTRGERPLPRNPIILTFDDGYEDNYSVAFPLLQKFGFTAVIFAVTDSRRTNFWDPDEPSAQLLSTKELQELSKQGIEIGSHTQTHPNLTTLPVEAVQKELHYSKTSLEQPLGAEVISFAYPYGALNPTIKSLVQEAGYSFAVAADSGPFMFYRDFNEIRRTQVFPWTTPAGFWKKTQPWYYKYKALKQ